MNINSVPIVSVVVPMFNVEAYIAKCIESVLGQSLKQFELILVDDGCSDNTLEIVQRFQDHRIRVISQANRGLSGARNTGIDVSRGLYVALLDADDYWAHDKLQQHVKHLNTRPMVGVSYSPSLFVDEQNELLGIGQFPKLYDISKQHVFCRNPVGNGSSPVIRRSLLEEVAYYEKGCNRYRKMYFNESLNQSEDIEFWTRIVLVTQWKFEGVAVPLTYYRVNQGGLSANIERQFACWQKAVELNREKAPTFFKQYYRLAKAYQLRYMARRAIQSNEKWLGLRLILKALCCDFRILLQEPKRTIITLGGAVLRLLPLSLYIKLERAAMQYLGKKQIS